MFHWVKLVTVMDAGSATELELVRAKLQSHLRASASYDVRRLLARLAGTQLWQEQVILHSKVRVMRAPGH